MRKYMIGRLGIVLGVLFIVAFDDCALGQGRSPLSTFPLSFATSQPLSQSVVASLLPAARDGLQRAVDASKELAGKDEQPAYNESRRLIYTSGIHKMPERFPRESHVAKYLQVRPWSWYYAPKYVREASLIVPKHQLQLQDGWPLRELLKDNDPAVRAMAAEALAILHQPEDVPLIARLLEDDAAAAPLLSHNPAGVSFGFDDASESDELDLDRCWQKETVAQCANRALHLMTGQPFENKAAFDEWWKLNSDARNCLWYWQERLERELAEADISTSRPRLYQHPTETAERYMARQRAVNRAARAEVHKAIAEELRQLPPEVEAKVRLLAQSRYAGGAPITGSESDFWPDPPNLRISSQRLLELLDRKNLWSDVSWDDQGAGMYDLLAERLGMWAHVLFSPADVPHIRAALAREHDGLGWSSRAAMIIGISRLLPVATQDKLDDGDTRDGLLRQAVVNEPDVFTRAYCAKELVNVGLPANKAFLFQAVFSEQEENAIPNVGQGILQALGEPPLTSQKRQFLVELLLDPKFEPFLFGLDNGRMDWDMYSGYAIAAVNAHAGRQIITQSLENRLTIGPQSAKALVEIRQIAKALLDKKD